MKKLLLLPVMCFVCMLPAQTFQLGPSNFGLGAGTRFLAFADLDHDGDKDAYSVNNLNHNIYMQNAGTKYAPSFAVSPYDYGLTPASSGLYFVDMDHDGDMDAWSVNGANGAAGTSFWLNTGNNAAPSFTNGQPKYGLTGGAYGISFVDIDNDGDMDAFTINGSLGTTFWRNIGTASVPSFTTDANFGLVATGTGLDFADMDNDGDMDAFTIDSTTTYWINNGTKYIPAFTVSQSNMGLNATGLCISLVDIDADGDVDAFSINQTGGAAFWENTSVVTGIKQEVLPATAGCWPNPFTTAVTISAGQPLSEASLVIYDLCGKTVRVMEHLSGAAITIDRGNLPEGLYTYKLSQNNALVSSGRLIAR